MRAISVALVFLHLSACAGISSSRDPARSGAEPSACGSSGRVTAGSESSHSFQASDSGIEVAIAAILMVFGLLGTLGDCLRAGATMDGSAG